eukprot:TRINITY_DN14501_c0_g1_i2.p2 TRINITY_DN14501_c0_g1~~TRINITY_DN14501_c0_g1_i2.p2  ORF type:complete len:127 (+),score=17.06 TRINITY_DN14501_c0_g1_i2:372-752(+)
MPENSGRDFSRLREAVELEEFWKWCPNPLIAEALDQGWWENRTGPVDAAARILRGLEWIIRAPELAFAETVTIVTHHNVLQILFPSLEVIPNCVVLSAELTPNVEDGPTWSQPAVVFHPPHHSELA